MKNALNIAQRNKLTKYLKMHRENCMAETYEDIAIFASEDLGFKVSRHNVMGHWEGAGLPARRSRVPKAAPAPSPAPTPAILEQNLAKLIAQNTELLEHLRRLDLRLTENEREIAATQTEVNMLNAAQGRAVPFPVTKPNGASKGARA